jgi:hypothetical protein
METVPSFAGKTDLACSNQLRRAKGPSQRIEEVLTADALALGNDPIEAHMHDVLYPGCKCRISENGCIDPSECQIEHKLFRIPILNRWCDQSTCRIRGGGELLLWSGWARPAAMKLLGRHPTVEQTRNLVRNSHPRTLHVRWRYDFIERVDTNLGTVVIDLNSNQYLGKRAKLHLPLLNPTTRFGQHTLYQATETE